MLIAGLIWLSRLNLPGQIASHQLDTSWSQALSYAFEHRMQAGKDYVFTFGPLGYFQTGVYSSGSWGIRVYGWEFLFMSTVAVTMCLPLRRMYSALERTLYVLALVVLPVELDAYAYLAMLAITVSILDAERTTRPHVGFAIVMLAIYALTKFTYFMFASVCVLGIAWCAAQGGHRRRVWLVLGAFVGYVVLLWCALGQSLLHFPLWVARSLQMSSGYSEAMSAPMRPDLVPLTTTLVGLLTAVALLHALNPRGAPTRRVASVVFLAALFLVFKASFVRGDHASILYSFCAAAPFLLLPDEKMGGAYELGRTILRCGAAAVAVLGFAKVLALTGLLHAQREFVTQWSQKFWWNVTSVLHLEDHHTICETDLATERAKYDLRRVREEVGDRPADMITCEQGVLFLNQLDWRPRPVFQSYATFTETLARLNAKKLESPDGPEFILFHLTSIDERLPTMDDSLALQVVARDYTPVVMERSYLLLEREPRPESSPRTVVLERKARIGEEVDVSQPDAQCVLLDLDLAFTLTGKLVTALGRAPAAYMDVRTNRDRTLRYRIVPSMMRGVILQPFIGNDRVWNEWYIDAPMEHPLSVRVDVGAAAALFDSEYSIVLTRADGVAPRKVDGMLRMLTAAAFTTPPTRITSIAPTTCIELEDKTVLAVNAPSELGFEIAAGPRKVHAVYGLFPATYTEHRTDGVRLAAVLMVPGAPDQTLFERVLDPVGVDGDRGFQTLDLAFDAPSAGELVWRADVGAKGNGDFDWCYLGELEVH